MKFVEQAVGRPHHCLVFPHLGATHRDGYLDTGNEIGGIDPHAYVSVIAVHEMAKLVGLPSKAEHEAALLQVEGLQAELEKVANECELLRERFDAVDVLASAGFVARRKPGRPAKEKVAA